MNHLSLLTARKNYENTTNESLQISVRHNNVDGSQTILAKTVLISENLVANAAYSINTVL